MSRAYLKEDQIENSGDELIPERVQSGLPNYITRQGLARLAEKVADLVAARQAASAIEDEYLRKQKILAIDRDLRFYQARLEGAIPVDPDALDASTVHFGSEVTVLDEQNQEHTYILVGEDEADVAQGRISWSSPLARALMGAVEGEIIAWERPSGHSELEVLHVRNARLEDQAGSE